MALPARLVSILKNISKTTLKGEALHSLAELVDAGGGGGGAAPTVDTLSGAGVTGKVIMKAANVAAARTAIGATTVGSALIVAADAAAGRTAIGAVDATGAVNAIKAKAQIVATTATVAPDATDLPTALTLVNELKADFNALRAAILA